LGRRISILILHFSSENLFKTSLHIINKDSQPTHAVLDRDFLLRNNLSLFFNEKFDSSEKERFKLFKEVASVDVLAECTFDVAALDINSNFGEHM